ncbi:beta strand repeat-containing protein [Agaribacterium haliotis]|uniref:beta strand repeat-containing protein n=1 Tax=Agaribacterium haliotis TaxID=2013869 RepID=UPI000BB55697|nr:hypothetical protein [Agaribacterium haliotis]
MNWVVNGDSSSVDGKFTLKGMTQFTAGSGIDTFAIQAGGINVEGGAGNDVYTLNFSGSNQSLTITDSAGTDSLSADSSETATWSIDGSSNNSVTADSSNNLVSFSSVDVLNGSALSDSVNVGGNGFTGTINGGDGADEFSLDASVSAINGGDGIDRFTYTQQASWSLSSDGNGNVDGTVFSSFENIVGSASADTFTLSSGDFGWSGEINGGDGDDTLNVSNHTDGVVVYFDDASLGEFSAEVAGLERVHVDAIENFVGHHDSVNGHEKGLSSESNNWLALPTADNSDINLIGDNEGSVVTTLNGNSNTYNFEHFGALITYGDTKLTADANSELSYGFLTTGNITLDYSGRTELIVVDITPQYSAVIGNDNVIVRLNSDDFYDAAQPDLVNTWRISDRNTGELTIPVLDDKGEAYVFNFENVNNLIGNDSADHFIFGPGGWLENGTINGAGGANAIAFDSSIAMTTSAEARTAISFGVNDLSAQQVYPGLTGGGVADEITEQHVNSRRLGNFIDIANVSELSFADAQNVSLMSADTGTYEWQLNANGSVELFSNSALVLSANNIDSVAGGAATDIFNLNSNNYLSIDAGDEQDASGDQLNVADSLLDIAIGIEHDGGHDIAIYGFEALQLNEASSHHIYGPEHNVSWVISGSNQGRISTNSGALSFSGASALHGNSAVDEFVFDFSSATPSFNGLIHGGGGADTIRVENGSQSSVTPWSFALSESAGLSSSTVEIWSIENLSVEQGDTHRLIAGDFDNSWSVTSSARSLSFASEQLLFSGIDSLQGGSQNDQFIFDGAIVAGVVDGGSDESGLGDSVQLDNLANQSVKLGASSDAGVLQISAIEHLENTHRDQGLATGELIGADETNNWLIAPAAQNLLSTASGDTLSFSGFAFLTGGSAADTFVVSGLDSSGNFAELRSISGGVNSDNGVADTLEFSAPTEALAVSFNDTYVHATLPTLYVSELNDISVNAGQQGNTIVGANTENSWAITGEANGVLNSDVRFNNFQHIVGGSRADTVTFTGSQVLSGTIDGGAQGNLEQDTINFGSIADVVVREGDSSEGYLNFENYIANGSGHFYAADAANTWTVSGANSGTLVGDSSLSFSGFSSLYGGSESDRFIVQEAGSVSGLISGGAGSDLLQVSIDRGADESITFVGGSAADTDIDVIELTAQGSDRYDLAYKVPVTGDPSLELSHTEAGQDFLYRVFYSEVEAIDNSLSLETISVALAAAANSDVRINNSTVYIDELTPLAFDDAEHLVLDLTSDDKLNIETQLTTSASITIQDASVYGDGLLSTGDLYLLNTEDVGASDQRLQTAVNNLHLSDLNGETWIAQNGSVNIAALSGASERIDLDVSNGDVSDSNVLSAAQAVAIKASGNIELNNSNELLGPLYLEASRIDLQNSETTLASLIATEFNLTTTGDVSDEGAIVVDRFSWIGADDSDLLFDHDANNIASISLLNGNNATIENTAAATQLQANLLGDLSVNGNALRSLGDIRAASVNLNAANDAALINHALSADSSVRIVAEGIEVNAPITVSAGSLEAIYLDAGSSALSLAANLDAVDESAANGSAGDVHLLAGSLSQAAGTTIDAANLYINVANDAVFAGSLSAQNTMSIVSSAGAIETDVLRTQINAGEQLSLQSQDTILLGEVNAGALAIDVSNGGLQLDAPLTLTGDGAINVSGSFVQNAQATLSSSAESMSISAGSVEQNADVTVTNGSFLLSSAAELNLNGQISSASSVFNAGGALNMGSLSSVSATGDITMTVANDLNATLLEAGQTVTLAVGGRFNDVNDSGDNQLLNIVADSLYVDTGSGFGSNQNRVEMQVANLNLANGSGEIGISNNSAVNIEALINQGDIYLDNTGTVTLINNSSSKANTNYQAGVTGTRDAGGVVDAGRYIGNVTIHVNDGALAAGPDPVSIYHPDIVAVNLEVGTTGGLGGSRKRPLVLGVDETVTVIFGSGFRPLPASGFQFNLETTNDLADTSISVGLASLIIEVESAEEIDPAVFSSIYNYAYEDVSILMPRDQRQLEDEEEEDEETLFSRLESES